MAIKITTDKKVTRVRPKNKVFTLEELQKQVDGYIELLPLKRVPEFKLTDAIMVMNEEGKLLGLPMNQMATDLLTRNYPKSTDVIVGDVLICKSKEIA
jgi:hypothetical protein